MKFSNAFNERVFKTLILLLFFLKGYDTIAQVAGCKDPLASNYNSLATVNDGTCTYNSTSYTPPIKVDPVSDSLTESSGLQLAGNSLWSFNDRDGSPTLYRIDSLSKTLQQTVILGGATNIDWEDIAFDGTYLYIGDFGNNLDGARSNLVIYKFPIAAIPDYTSNPVVTLSASLIEVIHFSYADQPQPPVATTQNTTQYDCEAMIVEGGKIHLFTKNWASPSTTHYVINTTNAGTYTLMPLETLVTNYLVTAADISPIQKTIVLIGYQNNGTAAHFMHLLTDYNAGKFFNGNKRLLSLPDATVMGQAEGICFRNDSTGYISNEKFVRAVGPFTISINQKLRWFDMGPYLSSLVATYVFTGNGNWNVASNWRNNSVPATTLHPGSEIIIDPVSNGHCILNIPYNLSPGTTITIKPGKNLLIQGNLSVQ